MPREHILHEAEETADDAHGEESQDDDNRADLLLEELAAQQRQQHGGQARNELVEVALERGGLDLIKTGRAERGVLRKGALDAIGG